MADGPGIHKDCVASGQVRDLGRTRKERDGRKDTERWTIERGPALESGRTAVSTTRGPNARQARTDSRTLLWKGTNSVPTQLWTVPAVPAPPQRPLPFEFGIPIDRKPESFILPLSRTLNLNQDLNWKHNELGWHINVIAHEQRAYF
jgi:hypothetical protein